MTTWTQAYTKGYSDGLVRGARNVEFYSIDELAHSLSYRRRYG